MPDDPIVLSVAEFYELQGLDEGNFPITTEVRDQLAEILRSHPGPQIDALFKAVMTTVANLELAVLNLTSSTREVYVRLLDLETRLLESGYQLGPPTYPEPVAI
ncbi:hypothetical protein ACRU44_00925 [Mycobacterium colombiense]